MAFGELFIYTQCAVRCVKTGLCPLAKTGDSPKVYKDQGRPGMALTAFSKALYALPLLDGSYYIYRASIRQKEPPVKGALIPNYKLLGAIQNFKGLFL